MLNIIHFFFDIRLIELAKKWISNEGEIVEQNSDVNHSNLIRYSIVLLWKKSFFSWKTKHLNRILVRTIRSFSHLICSSEKRFRSFEEKRIIGQNLVHGHTFLMWLIVLKRSSVSLWIRRGIIEDNLAWTSSDFMSSQMIKEIAKIFFFVREEYTKTNIFENIHKKDHRQWNVYLTKSMIVEIEFVKKKMIESVHWSSVQRSHNQHAQTDRSIEKIFENHLY